MSNGDLLARAAAGGFDALVTLDVGIQFQQNPAVLACSVVILRAPSNKIDDLRPLVPALLVALDQLEPRTLVTVT